MGCDSVIGEGGRSTRRISCSKDGGTASRAARAARARTPHWQQVCCVQGDHGEQSREMGGKNDRDHLGPVMGHLVDVGKEFACYLSIERALESFEEEKTGSHLYFKRFF